MISPKHLLFLVVFILPFACTEKNITNQSNLGNISGRVGYEDNTGFIPLEGARVEIPGTSVEVSTDSAGNYLILNLPAGTYNMRVSYYGYTEKYHTVSVSAGHTTEIPDIILTYSSLNYPYFLASVFIRSPNYGNIYLYMNDTSVVDIDRIGGDSLLLIAELNDYYYQNLYQDTTLTVSYDSDLYYTETLKGILQLRLPVKENFCEIRIWEGHSAQPNNAQFITTILVTEKIDIRIFLDWNTSYGNSAGDFDIHLIHIEDQDSCWYKNPRPDWGIKGFYDDNPRLYDDMNFYGNYSADEELYMDYSPDGSYIIKAIYFSNMINPRQQVTAQLTLRMDGVYYYYYAPADMSVGQVWTILEFDIPSKTIIPINTINGPIKQTAVKEVQ